MKTKPSKKQQISSNAIAFRLAKKKFKRITRKLTGTALALIISTSTLLANHNYVVFEDSTLKTDEEITLTVTNLYKALIQEGVQHADIVLRQAILETGWLNCSYCSLNKNNVFGFYYKNDYIKFSTWQESVKYYKRWQDRHYKGGDYYDFLVEIGYATDPQYIKLLKGIKPERKLYKED